MRISTNQMFQRGVDSMLQVQADQNKTQQQLSTGRRILSPSDDPSASAQALLLQQSSDVTDQYQKNADAATAKLSLEDQSLGSATELLQRVRELAVQANSAALSDDNRKSIAVELRQQLGDLMNLANSQDANGEYLFSGFQGMHAAYSKLSDGTYSYNGDEGQRHVQVGPNNQIALGDPGSKVFGNVPDGNGTFVTALGTANRGTAQIDEGAVNGTFIPDRYTIAFSQPVPGTPATYQVTDSAGNAVTSGTYADGGKISFKGAEVTISGTPVDGDTFTVKPSARQNIFSAIDTLASTLEQPAGTSSGQAARDKAIATGVSGIDHALTNVSNVRAEVGSRINAVNSQKDANDNFKIQMQNTLSSIQDLDYTQAISQLNRQTLVLQAAQQSYAKIQGLSLFNYLR